MYFNKKVTILLHRLGLSDSEIAFYLTVYRNPYISMKDIEKLSGISRASIYRAYERLKDLDLVQSSQENYRKNIFVVSLNKLADKLAQERLKLRKAELELKKLDNLMNLSTSVKNEESMVIITDRDEIASHAYDLIHQKWDHLLSYGSADRLIDILGEDIEKNFVNKRSEHGKSCSALLTEYGEYTQYILPNNDKDLRDVHLNIDDKNQDYMTYIYNDEVTIWHHDRDLGDKAVIIKDPLLVQNYKGMFDHLWHK